MPLSYRISRATRPWREQCGAGTRKGGVRGSEGRLLGGMSGGGQLDRHLRREEVTHGQRHGRELKVFFPD